MNERKTEEGLSTAAMAEASERRAPEGGGERAPTASEEPEVAPEAAAVGPAVEGEKAGTGATPLFSADDAQGFRSRWDSVQAGFVDNPRQAVEQADGLVAETMKRLAEVFAEERANLERQWDSGDDISTEDLRVALQRYRSFFDRLLSI
jgi:hypothetical protein